MATRTPPPAPPDATSASPFNSVLRNDHSWWEGREQRLREHIEQRRNHPTPLEPWNTPPALPPQGWEARSLFGLLRASDKPGSELARLADVAAFLEKRLPTKQVTYRLWSPLIVAASEGRHVPLYLCNAHDFAFPVFRPSPPGASKGNKPNQPLYLSGEAWAVLQRLSDVTTDPGPEDVLRSLADGWDRVIPLSGPVENDVHHALVAAPRAARERADLERMGLLGLPDDLFLKLLNALAVPMGLALELWGYGEAAIQAVDAAVTAAPDTYNPPWLAAKGLNVAWLKGERDRFKQSHPNRFIEKLLEFLAQKGVEVPNKDKPREIRRVLEQQEEPSGKAKKVTPFTGLGSRKTAGKR